MIRYRKSKKAIAMTSGPFPANMPQNNIKPVPGEYEARIVDVETIQDVRCGQHIADIYKIHYDIEEGDFKGFVVKDNGVFRYKEKDGFMYEPKRNWGYARFCELLRLPKGSKTTPPPAVNKNKVNGYIVRIDLSYKTFVNELGTQVSYPIAKLIKLLSEVPF